MLKSSEPIIFGSRLSINLERSELSPSVDKCVELPLSGCLIVPAKKYEATFIRTNNGVTRTHTQTTAEGATTLSIMALCVMTLSIMTLNLLRSSAQNDTKQNVTQQNNTHHTTALSIE